MAVYKIDNMKKTLFAGFLLLGLLAIGIQVAAITDSKKAESIVPTVKVKKTPTPRDLVYYRSIFFENNKEGC